MLSAGCKIKGLRNKTGVYIKTPVRGEDPVFKITGQREQVAAAKKIILESAAHFTKIRANKRNGAPNGRPDDITIRVRVPIKLVGLVVGSKGATIKSIQQRTDTYIITPSREKDPVFEVKGQEVNVVNARRLVYEHICERTGMQIMNLYLQNGWQQDYDNKHDYEQLQLQLQLLLADKTNLMSANSANDALTSSSRVVRQTPSSTMVYCDRQFANNCELSDEGFIGSPRDQPTTPENTPPSVWSASECPMMPKKVRVNSPMQRRPTDFGANNSASLGCYSDMTSPMFGFDSAMGGGIGGGAGNQQQQQQQHQQFDTLSNRSSTMTTTTSGGVSARSSPLSSADSSPMLGHGGITASMLCGKACAMCHKQGPPAMMLPWFHSSLCHACAQVFNAGDAAERK